METPTQFEPPKTSNDSSSTFFVLLLLAISLVSLYKVVNPNLNKSSSATIRVANNSVIAPTPISAGYILTFEYNQSDKSVVLIDKKIGAIAHQPQRVPLDENVYYNFKSKHGKGNAVSDENWISIRKNNIYKPAINGKFQFDVGVPLSDEYVDLFDSKNSMKSSNALK